MSLVNTLVDTLSVERDSAYWSIRGETLLTFSEINKISNHF